jgi:hypothetical protein
LIRRRRRIALLFDDLEMLWDGGDAKPGMSTTVPDAQLVPEDANPELVAAPTSNSRDDCSLEE